MAIQPDPQDRWRLVRVGTDLLSQWGTRTDRGERISAEWGEPDADGVYQPVFTIHPIEGPSDFGEQIVHQSELGRRIAAGERPRW